MQNRFVKQARSQFDEDIESSDGEQPQAKRVRKASLSIQDPSAPTTDPGRRIAFTKGKATFSNGVTELRATVHHDLRTRRIEDVIEDCIDVEDRRQEQQNVQQGQGGLAQPFLRPTGGTRSHRGIDLADLTTQLEEKMSRIQEATVGLSLQERAGYSQMVQIVQGRVGTFLSDQSSAIYKEQNESMAKQLEEASSLRAQLRSKISQLVDEKDESTKRITDLEKQVQEMKDQATATASVNDELTAKLQDLSREHDNQERTQWLYNNLQAQVDSLTEQRDDLQRQIGETKAEIASKDENIVELGVHSCNNMVHTCPPGKDPSPTNSAQLSNPKSPVRPGHTVASTAAGSQLLKSDASQPYGLHEETRGLRNPFSEDPPAPHTQEDQRTGRTLVSSIERDIVHPQASKMVVISSSGSPPPDRRRSRPRHSSTSSHVGNDAIFTQDPKAQRESSQRTSAGPATERRQCGPTAPPGTQKQSTDPNASLDRTNFRDAPGPEFWYLQQRKANTDLWARLKAANQEITEKDTILEKQRQTIATLEHRLKRGNEENFVQRTRELNDQRRIIAELEQERKDNQKRARDDREKADIIIASKNATITRLQQELEDHKATIQKIEGEKATLIKIHTDMDNEIEAKGDLWIDATKQFKASQELLPKTTENYADSVAKHLETQDHVKELQERIAVQSRRSQAMERQIYKSEAVPHNSNAQIRKLHEISDHVYRVDKRVMDSHNHMLQRQEWLTEEADRQQQSAEEWRDEAVYRRHELVGVGHELKASKHQVAKLESVLALKDQEIRELRNEVEILRPHPRPIPLSSLLARSVEPSADRRQYFSRGNLSGERSDQDHPEQEASREDDVLMNPFCRPRADRDEGCRRLMPNPRATLFNDTSGTRKSGQPKASLGPSSLAGAGPSTFQGRARLENTEVFKTWTASGVTITSTPTRNSPVPDLEIEDSEGNKSASMKPGSGCPGPAQGSRKRRGESPVEDERRASSRARTVGSAANIGSRR